MKILQTQIKSAFTVSEKVYDQKISRKEGIDNLTNIGMNSNTAGIYISVYQYLIKGQSFSRTLGAESFDYFLEKILTEKGQEQLFITLGALKKHIDYFESIQKTEMLLVREVLKKYSKIYSQNNNINADVTDDDELAFPEGKQKYRLHLSKERNIELVKLAKEKYFKNVPLLSCQVCGFSFVSNYGELGKDYIEAHHTIPVSELNEDSKTKIEDLAMVCSNCHRMLHRKRPWLAISELAEMRKRYI